MAERCNQCLYGPDKIVSNKRRAEILRQIGRADGYFICHKASMVERRCACRGDWDQRGCGQLGRIAGRIGAVMFVSEVTLSSAHCEEK
jgi:hypothetical protein